MPKIAVKRVLPVSTSCLLIMGFLAGIAPLANADEALDDQKTNIEQVNVEALSVELVADADQATEQVEAISTELLAEMHVNLEYRLRTEIAVALEPTVEAESMQADNR